MIQQIILKTTPTLQSNIAANTHRYIFSGINYFIVEEPILPLIVTLPEVLLTHQVPLIVVIAVGEAEELEAAAVSDVGKHLIF